MCHLRPSCCDRFVVQRSSPWTQCPACGAGELHESHHTEADPIYTEHKMNHTFYTYTRRTSPKLHPHHVHYIQIFSYYICIFHTYSHHHVILTASTLYPYYSISTWIRSHHSAWCLRQWVVCRVHPGDGALEDSCSIRHYGAVILNTLQPPPHGITAVISCSYALAKQVGYQTVPQSAGKGQDDVPERDGECIHCK